MSQLSAVVDFLTDIESLKLVTRKAYVSDLSRRENSAEHSYRLMPFIVNLATEGRNWRELSISRSQVLQINEPVQAYAPDIYAWMVGRIETCVAAGWLRDA
jgi:hypothetical protein